MARDAESWRRTPRRFYGSCLDGPRRPAPHAVTDGRCALDQQEALDCLGAIHASAGARREGNLAGQDRHRCRSDRRPRDTGARRDGGYSLRPVARCARPAPVAYRRPDGPLPPRVELAEPRLHELRRVLQSDPRQLRDQLCGGARAVVSRAPCSVWLAAPRRDRRRVWRSHDAGHGPPRSRCDADGGGRGAGRPGEECDGDGRS